VSTIKSEENISANESNSMTIILFIASTLMILLLFLSLYRIGVVQAIQEKSKGLIHSTLLLNGLLLVGAVYGVLISFGKMKAEDLGLTVEKLPLAVAVGIVIWISIQILEGIVGYAISGTIAIESLWRTEGAARIGLLIGMLFGTALFEEIGFRGFLLVQLMAHLGRVVGNRTLSIGLALLVSQTFFTLIHVPWKVINQGWTTAVFLDLIFSVFMNGMIYGLFYLRTQNLFFVMIVHALGNAPSLLIKRSIEPSIVLLLLSIICCAVWPKLNASASIWPLERKEASLPPEDSTGNVG
jgi:membrane protease YdiL (CAAX protease family)